MSAPKPSTALVRARELVAELESDHRRLTEMAAGASERARAARRGEPQDLQRAAHELGGLTAVLGEVEAELHVARVDLEALEVEHQHALTEHERDQARRGLDVAARGQVEALRLAVDAALDALKQAGHHHRDAQAAHARLIAATEALGEPAPRALRPPNAEVVAASRADPLTEDAPLAAALIAALQSHPVAQGRARAEVIAERDARQTKARASTAQRHWDTMSALASRAGRAVGAEDQRAAEAATAWLREHPTRPEVGA